MEEKFIKNLTDFGLNEIEAKIYGCLLDNQKMTISEISRSIDSKRTTCYQYLDNLLTKGFIIRIPIGKKMLYGAVDPRKVLQEYKKRFVNFEKNVEEMSQKYDTLVNKPKLIFYEGKRELKNIYEDLFKSVGDIYSIFPTDEFLKNFSLEEYDEYDKIINEHKFSSRDLIIDGKNYSKIDEVRRKNATDNKYTKKLPSAFKSNVDVLIYNNKVALISLRDMSAIVIENHDINEFFKSMHTFIWKNS